MGYFFDQLIITWSRGNCKGFRYILPAFRAYFPTFRPSELHAFTGIQPLVKGVAHLLHAGDIVGQGVGAGRGGAAGHDDLQILRPIPQKLGQFLVAEGLGGGLLGGAGVPGLAVLLHLVNGQENILKQE